MMIHPMIPTVGIWRLQGENIPREVLFLILSAILFVGISLLVAWALCRVLQRQNFKAKTAVVLPFFGLLSLALFARFGLSVTAIQGLFLAFVLLYASCSDIATHEVGDYAWVLILALAIPALATQSILSMVLAALFVFLPQMIPAWLPPHRTLGGADIKLSTALAFLLGGWRGIVAYLAGLLIAILFVCIYGKIKRIPKKQPFALVPFLSVAAIALFFV